MVYCGKADLFCAIIPLLPFTILYSIVAISLYIIPSSVGERPLYLLKAMVLHMKFYSYNIILLPKSFILNHIFSSCHYFCTLMMWLLLFVCFFSVAFIW
ncbi:hypothetical protein EB796_008211 [Bugula neritina]|uniref:Uncharacterized protein n=1 Tax=Bugula neritina TaxID=10212 RepID=A0A7J7K4B9_BUGNE|nr:hypothetical protein EB796_008211 [Bugula neritina]